MTVPDPRRPARRSLRRPLPRLLAAGLLVALPVVAIVGGARLLSPSIAASAVDVLVSRVVAPAIERPVVPAASPSASSAISTAAGRPAGGTPTGGTPPRVRRAHRPVDGAGTADGVVPAGTTVDDDAAPGVTRLDPALLAALRDAAQDASRDGLTLLVDSGWRSPRYQRQLLREAVTRYGSEAAAARGVATAETSPHVAGEAVDIGPPAAAAWLSANGARYGLCQIFRNEPWHYELRPRAGAHGCPRMYADPTRDPRMQS